MIGAALYLVVVAVLTVGLGTIIRNTAGGIAAFAAVFFVLPPLMNVLPSSWNNAISPYLPSNAGRAILNLHHGSDSLAPWTGFGVFAAYAAGSARPRGDRAPAPRRVARKPGSDAGLTPGVH